MISLHVHDREEAIDATFHMCALASSSVKLSGSMRPIFGNMRVMSGPLYPFSS